MFKFIRKKILEGMIKDFIADLPKYKEQALLILESRKDEVFKLIKTKITETLKEFFENALKTPIGVDNTDA